MPGRRRESDADVAENAEPLTVLDLDDPEIGLRPEDRFAVIPPGPRLVPRRAHDEATRIPVLLLAGLLGLFVLASWLGGVGSEDASDQDSPVAPLLDRITGTTLLLVGDDGVAAIEVGRGAARPVDDPGARALLRERGPRSRLVPTDASGRAWAVSAGPDGIATARELDLGDGRVTAEVRVEGVVVAATTGALIVERSSGVLDAVGRDGATVLTVAPSGQVLGAAGTRVATRVVDGCSGTDCGVAITDVATGATLVVSAPLSAGGTEFGSLSPDGRLLAVVRSDGVDTHGLLVDLDLGATIPFRARGVGRDTIGPTALAWSPDGAWLFVATERDGLDAVATLDGTTYRVGSDLPAFTAILTR
ncbi:MAG TPA: hypothetical protein VF152_10190 [Acidimicrobiia bacterium]